MNEIRPVIAMNMAFETVFNRESNVQYANYADRVYAGGGMPLLIPSIEDETMIRQYLSLADGVLLIGGRDYPPEYYGEKPHPETNLERKRPHFDVAFGKAVLASSLPVLGICAGHQLLSIVSGGKLIQHLPNAQEAHRNGLFHKAEITREGWMSRALGKKKGEGITVNSFHHQAVSGDAPGKDLIVTAEAFDGTIEAIELAGASGFVSERMVLGVQFHPERMDDIGPGFFHLLAEQAEKHRRSFSR